MSNREMPLPGGSVEEPVAVNLGLPEMPKEAPPVAPMPEQARAPEVPGINIPQNSAAPVDHKAASSGILVRALGPGMFDNHRKIEGMEFSVPSMDQLGSWMLCLDPEVQKKHQALMDARKQKRKTFLENLESKHRMMAGR
jgi:hypothetical protein